MKNFCNRGGFCQMVASRVFVTVMSMGLHLQAQANQSGPVPTTTITERGTPLSQEHVAQAQSLDLVKKNAESWNGKTVVLKGKVKQVCQSKGCWFILNDSAGGPSVRITSKGYLFFVPKDTSGFDAVVQGTFHVKKLSPAEASHFPEDAGEKIEPKDLPTEEYRLEAEGVRLSPVG